MTPEQKQTYRQHVKQNIEKCVELVGGEPELSKQTGFSVKSLIRWKKGSSDISYANLMHIINTTAQLERERIERIEVTYETVKPKKL